MREIDVSKFESIMKSKNKQVIKETEVILIENKKNPKLSESVSNLKEGERIVELLAGFTTRMVPSLVAVMSGMLTVCSLV